MLPSHEHSSCERVSAKLIHAYRKLNPVTGHTCHRLSIYRHDIKTASKILRVTFFSLSASVSPIRSFVAIQSLDESSFHGPFGIASNYKVSLQLHVSNFHSHFSLVFFDISIIFEEKSPHLSQKVREFTYNRSQI